MVRMLLVIDSETLPLETLWVAFCSVGLDRFFDTSAISSMNDENWEVPEALDWAKFKDHVDRTAGSMCAPQAAGAAARPAVLILEGFLLFHAPAVVDVCGLKLFVRVGRATCKDRRMSTAPVPEDYFDRLLWPAFERHGQPPPLCLQLDGEKQPASIAAAALGLLSQTLSHGWEDEAKACLPDEQASSAGHGATVDGSADRRSRRSAACEQVLSVGGGRGCSVGAGALLPLCRVRSQGRSQPPPAAVGLALAAAAAAAAPPQLQPPLPEAALVLSGSFNPPHRMHTECLRIARRCLEAEGFHVAAGFLAPRFVQARASLLESILRPHQRAVTSALSPARSLTGSLSRGRAL